MTLHEVIRWELNPWHRSATEHLFFYPFFLSFFLSALPPGLFALQVFELHEKTICFPKKHSQRDGAEWNWWDGTELKGSRVRLRKKPSSLQHTTTHCNTLQHAATHCAITSQTTLPRARQPGVSTQTKSKTNLSKWIACKVLNSIEFHENIGKHPRCASHWKCKEELSRVPPGPRSQSCSSERELSRRGS